MDINPNLTLEDRLHGTLTRKAILWLEMLENQEVDENGRPIYDLKTQMEVFKLCVDWIGKAKRFLPVDPNNADPSALDLLRQYMKKPPEEPKKPRDYSKGGRPTKAEAAARQRAKEAALAARANDDSQLAKLVNGKLKEIPK